MSDKKNLAYDSSLEPLHPKNRHAAKLLGWKFDPSFGTYRDKNGFVMMKDDPEPQPNAVDALR